MLPPRRAQKALYTQGWKGTTICIISLAILRKKLGALTIRRGGGGGGGGRGAGGVGGGDAGYEQQARFIQERISGVEKHFAEMCVVFGDYTRKTARLRDKGDEVARVLKEYADTETVNKSLSAGLANVSTTLSVIEEYRNATVQRLENKVIGELSQYDVICKHAREELKHTMTVRDRELSRKKVLERARERQPFNRQQITYAESELLKASAEMSRTAKTLSEQTDFFERRKLQQLKALLSEFIRIEMAFHAKSLELLTVAHQQVADINDKSDLENFRRKLRSPERTSSGGGLAARTGSLASLLGQHQPPKIAETDESADGSDLTDDSEGSDSNDTN